jgi:hypothetical protein
MSGAAQGSGPAAKLGEDKKAGGEAQKEQQTQQPALLEEDDEFEDFPVEGVLMVSSLCYRPLLTRMRHRLDRRGEQSTWRECTSMGGELG